MPPAGETLVRRLGALLREVTSDRPADAVHAGIVELVARPEHDPRLAAVADAERFAVVWKGLGSGSSLPADAWHSVVLPTIVAFSSPHHLKAHLELATSHWMTASAAIDEAAQTSSADAGTLVEPQPEPTGSQEPTVADGRSDPPEPPSHLDIPGAPHEPARSRRLRRALIAATAMAILTAAALWWTQ